MASKRHLRRKACEGKIQFTDQGAALQACYSYKREHGQFMTAYRCKFCSKFHIGHPPKRVRQAIHGRD